MIWLFIKVFLETERAANMLLNQLSNQLDDSIVLIGFLIILLSF